MSSWNFAVTFQNSCLHIESIVRNKPWMVRVLVQDGDIIYLRKIHNFVNGNVLRLYSDFLALDWFIATRPFLRATNSIVSGTCKLVYVIL